MNRLIAINTFRIMDRLMAIAFLGLFAQHLPAQPLPNPPALSYPQLPGQPFPAAGKSLSIQYDPAGTILEKEAAISGTAFFFDSTKRTGQEKLEWQKKKGLWRTSLKIPAGTALVHLFFTGTDGKTIEDNNGNGYLLPVYKKGRPVQYAFYRMSNLSEGIPLDDDRLKKNQKQALQYMKDEISYHPESEAKLMHAYYNMLANSSERADKLLLLDRLSKMTSDKEEDLMMAQLYQFYLGSKKQADSLDEILTRRFPNGEYVKQKKANPASATSDPGQPATSPVNTDEIRRQLLQSKVDEPVTPLTLTDLSGHKVTIGGEDLKGKILIIDFWATWCKPCIASFNAMQQLVNKYKDRPDIRFLFICTQDAPDKAVAFMQKTPYPFTVLLDEKTNDVDLYKAFAHYKVEGGIPCKIVLDKRGHIRFRTTGFNGNDQQLIEEVSAMIRMAEQD
jgi:thiol-disulfide isomerase/thioredoxin